ncbi:DUF4381 domain-containing protein [Formosa sediminum]|uniref:DUF4381 domain-containing protein n=1 Tax=Formosa sediminum TaxID=2594004 RepID=A0A516GLS9_9FLAO|nr:DUF4381 domain-containing protein [Formosa sediminum]QDO92483.1 DUF4381 domain-containing protein [Formosa sediminum]
MYAFVTHSLVLVQDSSLDVSMGEIIEPTPVPFSFDTLGWKIVFVLLVLVLFYIGYRVYKNYKKKQYLRDAIAHIDELKKQSDLGVAAYINAVMFQLKETALHTFGRSEVAGLYGRDWLQFLDKKVKGANFEADETLILDAVYKHEVEEPTAFNKEVFSNKSINWIKQHAR